MRALRGWTTRIALMLATGGGLGCYTEEPLPEPAPRDGTARMADTLAVLYARALTDPLSNPFLNRERAAAIKAMAAAQTGAQALNARHWMADELLRAGQTREAIAELEALMRDAGASMDTITPRKKPVFDLLAIAYLRLGEQENCLDNPAANVCILPLKGGGRHTKQEGARAAIARYTQILEHFPEDRGSRYLLNIAWLAVGGYPDSVPRAYLIPNLAPRANDPFPLFPNVARDVGLAVTGLAGGLSVEDFNEEGLLDVFTTGWGLKDPVHVFLADGQGGYDDLTAKSGLEGIVSGLNTVHADYDNDGDADVLVLRGAWLGESGRLPDSLLRNRGDGTFEDVTFASGLLSFHPTQAAAWADFNLDGHLDLFIGNKSQVASGGPSHRSELFLNNGNGTFTEISRQVGIDLDDFVKGVVWGDVNNDGLPDLYASVLDRPNRLCVNRGGSSAQGWRFEESAAAAGVQMPAGSFPTWFWDFDNDGREDLLVLSYDFHAPLQEMAASEYLGLPLTTVRNGRTVDIEPSRLYRNKGDGTFEDVTQHMGLGGKAIYAMG